MFRFFFAALGLVRVPDLPPIVPLPVDNQAFDSV